MVGHASDAIGGVMHGDWRYYVLDAVAHAWPSRSTDGEGVVVYSPGHLGDILHTVPMLRKLRTACPSRRLYWIVGPWSENLARRYSDAVDEIVVFSPDFPNFYRTDARWRQGMWKQWDIGRRLRSAGIEYLVTTLPENTASRFLANAIVPRVWIGVEDRRPPRVNCKIQTEFHPYEKDRYQADAQVGLLRSLGIEGLPAFELEYTVTPVENEMAVKYLKQEGIVPGSSLALISPGSGWSGKNWPPDRFGEIANWLEREKNIQVAWIGSREEKALMPASRPMDRNWMGSLTLAQLAAVMAHASLWVGNDSGTLHLAAAVGIPTVSVWGPTSPGKWGPRGSKHRQVKKWEKCPGCVYWDWRASCLMPHHECMEVIATGDVLAAIDNLLYNDRNCRWSASPPWRAAHKMKRP